MVSLKVVGASTTPAQLDRGAFPSQRWWSSLCAFGLTLSIALSFVSVSWLAAGTIAMSCAAVAWSDVRWRRIPNAVTASMVLVAVFAVVVSEGVSVFEVTAGAVVTCAPALGLHLVNPSWVGFGDVKLLFSIGALVGLLWWPAGVAVLWLAMVAALATRPLVPASWRSSIPFGFWLSLCAVPVSIFLAGSIVS